MWVLLGFLFFLFMILGLDFLDVSGLDMGKYLYKVMFCYVGKFVFIKKVNIIFVILVNLRY